MGLVAHSTPAQLAPPLSTAQLHSKQGVECPCQIKYRVQSTECRVQSVVQFSAMNDGVDTELEVIGAGLIHTYSLQLETLGHPA